MEYKIVGTYRGNTEEIDTADTRKEAQFLRAEYRLAYGAEWSISIKRGRKESE